MTTYSLVAFRMYRFTYGTDTPPTRHLAEVREVALPPDEFGRRQVPTVLTSARALCGRRIDPGFRNLAPWTRSVPPSLPDDQMCPECLRRGTLRLILKPKPSRGLVLP